MGVPEGERVPKKAFLKGLYKESNTKESNESEAYDAAFAALARFAGETGREGKAAGFVLPR